MMIIGLYKNSRDTITNKGTHIFILKISLLPITVCGEPINNRAPLLMKSNRN